MRKQSVRTPKPSPSDPASSPENSKQNQSPAMARPCNSVDPEEHYRRLERLLTELYLVLRALFNQGAPLLPPTNYQPPPSPPPSEDESGSTSRRDRGGRPGRRQPPGGGRDQEGSRQDRSGGGCGHQNQRTCHLLSAPSCNDQKDESWDRIGHSLKNIADHLDTDLSKCSPNLTGIFKILVTLFFNFPAPSSSNLGFTNRTCRTSLLGGRRKT